MITNSLTKLFKNTKFILIVYLLIAIIACLAKIAIDLKPQHTVEYISRINNFIIYRNSFFHLIQHHNLYGYFPTQQYDEFLYSPTFALLIAPFAALPLYVGVVFWCAFNAAAIFVAIRFLPTTEKHKIFIYWFVLIELVTSIQNVQVNPLIASLFLFTFIAFENKNIAAAAFCVALSMYIKVFGILGASLFLIYPDKIKFIGYFILWTILLFSLPLIIVSTNELIILYQNWFYSLTSDHAKNIEDVSVMRMLSGISGISFGETTKLLIQLTAICIFCLKYVRTTIYENQYCRYLFLSTAMIWSIIFNHAAESSTYIIAMVGVAIWYTQIEHSKLNITLLFFAFILCSLSPTDIFPKFIRHQYIVPFALKALPCLCIYLLIEYNLITTKTTQSKHSNCESSNTTN
jgi:hypothetical protein